MFSRRALLIGIGALVVTACSDSTAPLLLSPAQLVGEWNLDRVEMVLASDPHTSRDVTTGIGLIVRLTINADKTAVLAVSDSEAVYAIIYGSIGLHGDTIVWYPESGTSYSAKVTLAGPVMTWLSLNTSDFDMDADGQAEQVFERDVWQRR